MYNINEIVGCIIRLDHAINMEDMQDTDLTNLKLQKLLYYIQGHFLAEYNNPLFTNDFYAWQHGPVVPEIYHNFKHNGCELIGFEASNNVDYECSNLVKDEEFFNFIIRIMKYYNQYSPWKLRDMTHEETPWKSVVLGNIISKDSIKECFKQDFIKARI